MAFFHANGIETLLILLINNFFMSHYINIRAYFGAFSTLF